MNQYFAYIRVSTTKQGELGVSLPQQREAIERYAQRGGLEICRWFEEQETAAKRGRPVFNTMVRLLRTRAAAGVLIHKIDRSARNLRDWADLGELIDGGVQVHFANESLDLTSRGGRLSADIQAVVAADYIRNLREESKKGFYGRLKQGYFPMHAPLGYLDNGGAKAKTLDPRTAPLIRQAFELYASARYSLVELGNELWRRGLRRANGTPFPKTQLSKMLNNTFYYGLIYIEKTRQSFPGVHEPLIPRTLFERVQRVLTGKANTSTARHDLTYRKRLRCATCEYSLIGETAKGYTYYRCHTRTCPTNCVREDAVEAAVLQQFSLLRFSPMERAYIQEQLATMRAGAGEQQQKATAALKLRLSQATERLARLTDAYIDRLIEQDTFEERKKALLAERLDLETQLRDWESGKLDLGHELSKYIEHADDAYRLYKNGTVDEKRDLLDLVTSECVISRKSPTVVLKLPFRTIADREKSNGGGPSRDAHRNAKRFLKQILSVVRCEPEPRGTPAENS